MGETRSGLRAEAEAAFDAGVRAADPAAALSAALARHPLPEVAGRVIVIAVGKAAGRMAETARAHLDGRCDVLAVTNYENAREIAGVEVIAAAHPVPDENGLRAGRAVIARLDAAGEDDLVLCLISGGASALLPAPVAGLGLADKIAVNERLLASGLDIGEMNLVRQSLSELKGGGMLRHAAPARVVSFLLSDVLGDDLRIIGSGPSVGPIGSPAEARRLLRDRGLWEGLPAGVRTAFDRAPAPVPGPPEAHLVGSNAISLAAMARAARATASQPALTGDVTDAAARIVREAMAAGPGARLAFGGETTVTLTGKGLGGRNQELALRVAREADRAGLAGPWCFLSGGTDGRDGPTDAAGGIADHTTCARLAAAGVDPGAILADNDSYPALEAVGDLLMIGATGTNVADLQLMLRG